MNELKMSHANTKGKKKKQEENIHTKIFATSGDVKGDIKLFWEPSVNVFSYVIQRSIFRKVKMKWQYVDITNYSDYTVTGLRPGRKYCFRIAQITAQGQGSWSKPVIKTAP